MLACLTAEPWSLMCLLSCNMNRAKRETSWVTWAVDAAMQGGKARSADFAIPGSAVKWCDYTVPH